MGDQLHEFVTALKAHTRYDLTDYSDRSLRRRVKRVMDDGGFTFPELIERIEREPEFAEEVVSQLTVNTSSLFRDPLVWQSIRSQILPRYRHQRRLNVWHVGCSKGQEVYSLMMLLNECDMLEGASIYASDINQKMLRAAQLGEYFYRFNLEYLNNFDIALNQNPLNYDRLMDVPYTRYMEIDREGDRIVMRRFLRGIPKYVRSDLVRCENPFDVRFDLIFCRNVLIYFNTRLQNRVYDFFYHNMHPGGTLILGANEAMSIQWGSRFHRVARMYIRKS